MRFVCDQDVDAGVAVALRRMGHDAWTVGVAGLARAADDALTAYAMDHGAALLTHDIEFSQRRRHNVIGQHLFLRCNEWDAVVVLEEHMPEVLPILEHRPHVWMRLSRGVDPVLSYDWR